MNYKFSASDHHGPVGFEIHNSRPDPILVEAHSETMGMDADGRTLSMAHLYATKKLTDGELEKAKEGMRNFLRKEAAGGLAPYAHKSGAAKNAPWVFEDRSDRKR